MSDEPENEAEIKELARDIVARFLSQWEGAPGVQVVERDGVHSLVMQAETFPYMTLHFNLEEKCRDSIRRFRKWDEDNYEEESRPASFDGETLLLELRQMATTAPKLLFDYHALLSLITLNESAKVWFGPLGQKLQERLRTTAEDVVQIILRRYNLEKIAKKPGPSTVIDEDEFLDVIFRLKKTNPSKRQLAKELKTTPSTVRSWLRSYGFTSPEELINDLLERLPSDDLDHPEAGSN